MNDTRLDTQDERFRDGKSRVLNNEDASEKLTTRDISTGVAAGPALEKSAQDATQPRADNIQPSQAPEPEAAPLFDNSESESFRAHWISIQSQFVDEPRKSVEEADELVAATMKRLAEVFAAERENLETEWDRGEDVSTEDLRIALQRYRSFFDRLLSV
jgi:hypothetical protein